MISSHYALVMTDLQAISYQKLSSPMNTTKAQMTNVLSTILICCMYSGAVDWSAAIWKLICICFTVFISGQSALSFSYSVVHSFPSLLVCGRYQVYCTCALPKRPINQFKLDQQNRKQALRTYCRNIYRASACFGCSRFSSMRVSFKCTVRNIPMYFSKISNKVTNQGCRTV